VEINPDAFAVRGKDKRRTVRHGESSEEGWVGIPLKIHFNSETQMHLLAGRHRKG
jgi:hypothetical protein